MRAGEGEESGGWWRNLLEKWPLKIHKGKHFLHVDKIKHSFCLHLLVDEIDAVQMVQELLYFLYSPVFLNY